MAVTVSGNLVTLNSGVIVNLLEVDYITTTVGRGDLQSYNLVTINGENHEVFEVDYARASMVTAFSNATAPSGGGGADGESAYEIAVRVDGFTGTEAEWLASLVGATGPKGDAGAAGSDGAQGPQGIQGIQGETGPQGSQGLKGDTGDTGPQGPQGPAGVDGNDATVTKAAVEAVLTGEISTHTHAGGGSTDLHPACYMTIGSTDITNTETVIPLYTTVVSNSNYLNSAGTVYTLSTGVYQVSYSIPIDDQDTTGGVRSRMIAYCKLDGVIIPQSRGQDYAREASGGQGVNATFIFEVTEASSITLHALQSGTVNVQTEADQTQMSIMKVG